MILPPGGSLMHGTGRSRPIFRGGGERRGTGDAIAGQPGSSGGFPGGSETAGFSRIRELHDGKARAQREAQEKTEGDQGFEQGKETQ